MTRTSRHPNAQRATPGNGQNHGADPARQGKDAVFQTKCIAISPTILENMERRDRAVFLLVNGKRTIQDIARLVHRPEIDVAYILVHLVKRNYIEFTDTGDQQQPRSN